MFTFSLHSKVCSSEEIIFKTFTLYLFIYEGRWTLEKLVFMVDSIVPILEPSSSVNPE